MRSSSSTIQAMPTNGFSTPTVRRFRSARSKRGSVTREPFYLKTHHTQVGIVYGGIGAAGFERLCTTPCEAHVPPGQLVFGLTQHQGTTVVPAAPVDVNPGAELHGKYIDRKDLRTLGWVSIGAGIVTAAGFALAASSSSPADPGAPDFGDDINRSGDLLTAGVIGALVLGGAGGLLLLLARDEAEVTAEVPGGKATTP